MSQIIYKYKLNSIPFQRVELPIGAEILSVQNQNGIPVLYALIDFYETLMGSRSIEMFATGEAINKSSEKIYISTVLFNNGALVYHFFETHIK